MKIQYKVLLSTILVSTAIFTIYKVKDSLVVVNETNKNQDQISTQVILQKLSVLGDKCTGCGKCIRIDPSHFELSSVTRKSIIISSANLSSKPLAQAINNCPTGAIVLQ